MKESHRLLHSVALKAPYLTHVCSEEIQALKPKGTAPYVWYMFQVDGLHLDLDYGPNSQDKQCPKLLTTITSSTAHLLPTAPSHYSCIIILTAVTKTLMKKQLKEAGLLLASSLRM